MRQEKKEAKQQMGKEQRKEKYQSKMIQTGEIQQTGMTNTKNEQASKKKTNKKQVGNKQLYNYSQIVAPILDWYDWNARILPWRQDPQPYYVWISEIMLQQTRVEAVKPYYDRFLNELPTIADLANVSDDRLMKLWEGLGYYNRARNLKLAARTIMEEYNGVMPASYEALQTLKGIGSYTAGAIASIAYGIQAPAVDGNVLRVAMRLENCYDDIAKASVKKRLEQELIQVIPKERAGDFNQSLIELGATVCIPNGRPMCEKCPLMPVCLSYHKGTNEELPIKAKKKARTILERTIFVLQYGDRYAIRKRVENGLLAGLWELPGTEEQMGIEKAAEFIRDRIRAFEGVTVDTNHAADSEYFNKSGSDAQITEKTLPLLERITSLGEARHIFSHVEWQMQGYLVQLTKEEAEGLNTSVWETSGTKSVNDLRWVTGEVLKEAYSIPSAFRAYIQW